MTMLLLEDHSQVINDQAKLCNAMLTALDMLCTHATTYQSVYDELIKLFDINHADKLSLSQSKAYIDNRMMVSYTKKESWNIKRRTRARMTRYLMQRTVLPSLLGTKLYDSYLGHIKMLLWPPTIEILQGRAIQEVYRNCTSDSCMRGCDSNKVELWTMSDNVRMAYLEEPYARSLLITCDDNSIVLDRCYPNHTAGTDLLRSWAKQNGYYHRENDSQCDPWFISPTGERRRDFQLTIPNVKGLISRWPYVDSFKYMRFVGDNAVMHTNERHNYTMKLTRIDGGLSGAFVCVSCYCEYADNERHTYDGDSYCEECYDEAFMRCDCCNNIRVRDDMYSLPSGDAVCEQCYTDECFTCVSCDDIDYNDNIGAMLPNGDQYCEHCRDNDLIECPHCNEYHVN